LGNELRTNEAHAALFVSLAESSRDFVAIAAFDGRLLYANPAIAALLEGAAVESEAPALEELFAPEDQAFVREVIWPAVRRDGRWHGDFRLHQRAAGRARNVRLSAFVLDRGEAEPAAVALTGHDIGEQRRAEQRLRTLVEAGPSLSNSLDYHQTLENLAQLVVRTLATFCVIDVFARAPGGADRIERIASSHVERGRRDEVRRLSRFRPSGTESKHPVARIFREGASSLVETVDDAWLETATISREHADAVRALGLRSLLAVPIVAGGKLLGALTCALADEARPRPGLPDCYDAEDLFFVEELGRRGGVAIENALTFEHERSIAVALQAASLPSRLPAGRGVRLHADYRPGSAEATIGGDWYDALVLDDGSFVFSIGDVVGHGLRAAILMTKLRQAMQAAALVDSDPNVVLAVADRTLRLHDPDAFATALAARYDPVTRRLRFASAGHPPPLLRHADGRVEELANPGLLLGMRSGDAGPTKVALMPRGATLLFHTDGLTEATRDIAEGQRRLATALTSGAFLAAANPAREVVSEVLQGREAGDDVAVLVVTFDYEAVANQA
jgi:PAS domain S-box-containing protein